MRVRGPKIAVTLLPGTSADAEVVLEALDGVREPENFVARVLTVAAERYPDGLPAPPSWCPVDTLQLLPPASALLLWMDALDLEERQVPWPLRRTGLSLLFLWIGIETEDEKRQDFALDTLLGTSGRGWLSNRMEELGLDRSEVRHEIQFLCMELIHDFAAKGSYVKDATKANGYFYAAFKNRLEDRLSELVRQRDLDQPPKPHDGLGDDLSDDPADQITAQPASQPVAESAGCRPSIEDELFLKLLLERVDNLSKQENDALVLRYIEGLEGKALGEALGTAPATARGHILNAIKKIRKIA